MWMHLPGRTLNYPIAKLQLFDIPFRDTSGNRPGVKSMWKDARGISLRESTKAYPPIADFCRDAKSIGPLASFGGERFLGRRALCRGLNSTSKCARARDAACAPV
jgi:hypothetical protein